MTRKLHNFAAFLIQQVMINKTRSYYIFLAFISASICLNLHAKEDSYEIPIYNDEVPTVITRPRVPALVPFSAYADTSTGELILVANTDCGSVHFCVVNTLSGDTYSSQSTALSQGDIFSYSIPWQTGLWQIAFTLDNGSSYSGQIVL